METRDLELFVELMRRRSFSDVATARSLAPSSVSRALVRLEEEVGQRLVQRSTRHVVPTEAGQELLRRLEPALEQLDHALGFGREGTGSLKGRLRITVPVSFGLAAFMDPICAFQCEHPEVEVDLVMTDAVVDLIGERMDVAFRLGVLPDSELIAHRLFSLRYLLAASPDYLERRSRPTRPADLPEHRCLTFTLASRSVWRFRRNSKVEEQPITAAFRSSGALAIRKATLLGVGIGMVPERIVRGDLADGSLVQVLSDYDATPTAFDGHAYLVYPSRKHLPRRTQAFIEAVRSCFDGGDAPR